MSNEPSRLEDFIDLATQGKDIQLSVDLKKQIVTTQTPGEAKGAKDMYLLSCDYSFSVDGRKTTVSKIYVSGNSGEPLNAAKQNTYVANARLKMDYMRLRELNIPFEEKFWEER